MAGLIDSDAGLTFGSGFQWDTVIGGAGLVITTETSSAAALLQQYGPDGLALAFDDDFWFDVDGFYGSAAIVGGGTQNNYNTSPDTTASSLLTYTSPSVKMTMGPSGTLRFGAHNLTLYSEAYGTTTFTTQFNASISTNTISISGASGYHFRLPGFSAVAGQTFSVTVTFTCSATASVGLNFRTNDDTPIAVVAASATAGVEQTVTFSGTAASSNNVSFGVDTRTTTVPGASNLTGATVLISRVHIRRTPSDSTYLATTTAARYALPLQWTSAGVLEGMLVEEARTNLALRSQEFDNAAWTKDGSTITANAITAPNGTLTADAIVEDGATSQHRIFQAVVVSAVDHAMSFYAKAGTRSWCYVGFTVGSVNYAWFDLANGVVGTKDAAYTSSSIESVGNGWYRCTVIATATAATWYPEIGAASADNVSSYAGNNGAVGVYVWQSDLQAGSFQTSPIPTIASTVTRAADNNTGLTSIFPFSATAGTLYFEGTTAAASGTQVLTQIDDGTENERFRLVRDSSNDIRFIITDGGVEQANINLGAVANNTSFKVAAAWAANDVAACLNGGSVGTDGTATLPTVTTLRIGRSFTGEHWNSGIAQEAEFARRLSNAELQAITGA